MIEFSTKAQTLENLNTCNLSADIPQSLYFKIVDWQNNQSYWLSRIKNTFNCSSYIVRSSSCIEDQLTASNAGAFLSVLDVNQKDLPQAINDVIRSYGKGNDLDEVLIQPMLNEVVRSGVAFSHDPNTSAPYRVINWSDGKNTSQITSGGNGKSWQQAALNPYQSNIPDQFLERLLCLIDQLLQLFNNKPLDCEFAFTKDSDTEILWLLQVRPLILQSKPECEKLQAMRLEAIESHCLRTMKTHPFLRGHKTIYGVMPDWNPAEILGSRPRPLALSLYKEMITDSIWAYQRHNYGYRNLRSHPLMQSFYGVPYIDVRVSFNSFIPSDLDDKIADKLVDYYIERLLNEPHLHDKVEFEIIFSCYSLDLDNKLSNLQNFGFSRAEILQITDSLRNLTNKIIDPQHGLWQIDKQKIETLKKRRELIYNSNFNAIERIYWLLEDGKRYGTLPFAGLARAAFIAVQFLKSLVSINVLTNEDYDNFLSNINTITKDISHDRQELNKSLFLSKYGHLRPGTYDIMSPRYDEQPDLYFDWDNQVNLARPESKPFTLTLDQMSTISNLLKDHRLNPDVVDLFAFLRSGIEQREYSKFQFTQNLSDLLSLVVKVGSEYGFSREDLSFVNINVFKDIYTDPSEIKSKLQESIDSGKKQHSNTAMVSLPPLIAEPKDIWAFEWPSTTPNYITQLSITANISSDLNKNTLHNTIVCIPNADPGFDWLFSYPIAGLITAWGGANSHMAIRAGELRIPAVIGCGEQLFKQIISSKKVSIDCSNRTLIIIA